LSADAKISDSGKDEEMGEIGRKQHIAAVHLCSTGTVYLVYYRASRPLDSAALGSR